MFVGFVKVSWGFCVKRLWCIALGTRGLYVYVPDQKPSTVNMAPVVRCDTCDLEKPTGENGFSEQTFSTIQYRDLHSRR